MEGNITHAHLGTPLYGNLIRELRTPLLEVLMAARSGGKNMELLTEHALQVYDGYILLQDMLSLPTVERTPCSLVAETEDALHKVHLFASAYGVELQLHATKLKSAAALNRQVFSHAVHSGLYGVITSLQNTDNAVVKVTVNGKNGPSIAIFSRSLEVLPEDLKAVQSTTGKNRPSPLVAGSVSGLVLADNLLQLVGSGLHASSNQHGKGFSADFLYSKQMSFLEAVEHSK